MALDRDEALNAATGRDDGGPVVGLGPLGVVPDLHFQICTLTQYSNGFVGTFKYSAPFDEL